MSSVVLGEPVMKSDHHTWQRVHVARSDSIKISQWCHNTFFEDGGAWFCMNGIGETSEIWFEFEKDATLCVLRWS